MKSKNKGTTLIEYALLLMLIFLVSYNAVQKFHSAVVSKTNAMADDFPNS